MWNIVAFSICLSSLKQFSRLRCLCLFLCCYQIHIISRKFPSISAMHEYFRGLTRIFTWKFSFCRIQFAPSKQTHTFLSHRYSHVNFPKSWANDSDFFQSQIIEFEFFWFFSSIELCVSYTNNNNTSMRSHRETRKYIDIAEIFFTMLFIAQQMIQSYKKKHPMQIKVIVHKKHTKYSPVLNMENP